uniref:Uncharacterized protein n=1 Tax=Castor canadensis TaxID=51338 RepID=A0A8C0ZMX7_CASCN
NRELKALTGHLPQPLQGQVLGNQGQPAEDTSDQEQLREEDQDKGISFTRNETCAFQDEGLARGLIYDCRKGICPSPEHSYVVCTIRIRWSYCAEH